MPLSFLAVINSPSFCKLLCKIVTKMLESVVYNPSVVLNVKRNLSN